MSFGTAYGTMKRNKKRMASGGDVAEPEQDFDSKALDMVDRICQNRYSRGGQVANETPPIADSMPNEFDDLVLRDDLEDDSGPGNEIGNEALEEDDADVVGKIMTSRKKKDRNPRPA